MKLFSRRARTRRRAAPDPQIVFAAFVRALARLCPRRGAGRMPAVDAARGKP